MATLEQALTGIRKEIADEIRQVAPVRPVKTVWGRFVEHDAVHKGQPIEEQSGPARLFEIKMPTPTGERQDGYTETIERYDIPVVFCYPRESRWYAVARGDLDKIRRHLTNDHGGHGVAGVNARWVIGDGLEEMMQSPDDPWDYYTLTVAVITQTTAS